MPLTFCDAFISMSNAKLRKGRRVCTSYELSGAPPSNEESGRRTLITPCSFAALLPPFVVQHTVRFDTDDPTDLAIQFPGMALPPTLHRAVLKLFLANLN
jgi:hypothetical protein